MKNRILKISIILVMIASMTMTNFLLVGNSLASYAMENNKMTNHNNVEFKVELKKEEETFLNLQISVKKEGYFNGEIRLENSNFYLKDSNSSLVNRIEENVIYLNQVNAGTIENIKIAIEPKKEEDFPIAFLNATTKINLTGIYRDSTRQDIKIEAGREVFLPLEENNTSENVKNDMKIMTNKIVEIEGEQKRILQISYHLGLQENNYPIEKIQAKIAIPEKAKGKIEKVEYLNNMTNIESREEEKELIITLSNPIGEEGKVNWKKQGDENVILTILYDTDIELVNQKVETEETVFLYNGKQIQTQNEIMMGTEEIDNRLEATIENEENEIYKGKLDAKINRDLKTVTKIKINYAKGIEGIEIKEEAENTCPMFYRRTIIKKEQVEDLLGSEGTIEIYDLQGEEIAIITKETLTDEQGNIVIDYPKEDIQGIRIQTTEPIKEGILNIYHGKTIQTKEVDDEKIKETKELKTKIKVNEKEIESSIRLKETETKAKIEINQNTLSTIRANPVEIKAILMTNEEKYKLYKNPEILIQLPEQVKNITVHSIDLFYGSELKISHYEVKENNIKIILEGEQLGYQEVVEGPTISINATIEVDKKARTEEKNIIMAYKNEETIHQVETKIQISAPQEVIPIYNIQDLNIETMGQEETIQAVMPRGAEEKTLEAQIGMINNKENAIQDVRILGEFPTDHKENNMGIEITGGIHTSEEEKTKIYYTENKNATDELEKEENGWTETIQDPGKVCKYLMIVEQLEVGEEIEKSYTYQVPNNLDYNKTAKTNYQVNFLENNERITNGVKSTNIEMETGVGPRIETKLTATVGGKEITGTVKNGEVIKYRMEISNTGTEDASNITVRGQVPEGTTMVVEEPYYEISGVSYYQELEDKTYETRIEKLEVGQVINEEYEVRVNTQTTDGKILKNQVEIEYGDVIKQSNEQINTTEKGNLRVTVKRVTAKEEDLYQGSTVKYYAMIENISNEKQENVKIKSYFSENLIASDYIRFDNNHAGEVQDYQEEIEIGTIESGKNVVISYGTYIKLDNNNQNQTSFSVIVTEGKKEYHSNLWNDEIKNMEIEMEMTAHPSSPNVKVGDRIEYKIKISNKSPFSTKGLTLKDSIPYQLTIKEVAQDGEKIVNIEDIEENTITIPIEMEGYDSTTITIETVVNHSGTGNEPEDIKNVAYVTMWGNKLAETSEIIHIIQANDNPDKPDPDKPDPDKPDPDKPDPDKPAPDDNKVDDNDVAKGKKMITGIAWYDENSNGKRDQGEPVLSGIKARLLNVETNHFVRQENGIILEAITNNNGIYILDKIGDGNYIVIFDYDHTKYDLTKYKVEGEVNSQAISSELQIEEEKQKVSATNILKMNNEHINNINIGLIKRKNFDLKLDKYINRIIVQDVKGTTIREYDNTTMAKIELDGKKIKGTVVTIEYKIKVTNQGEIEGYAKKITDYVSREFEFKEEWNKQWNQIGDRLTTTALANEKIQPGESKTIILTLSKTMTENNAGLISNTAEITEHYNELGIEDSNSIPGNRVKEENDFGSAEVIINIKTGGIIPITIGMISAILLSILVLVLTIKKRGN